MLGSLPQGLFFWKTDIPEILRHAHFEKSVILLRFGQNIHLDTQRDSREALWKASGGSQETLFGHLCLQGLGTQSGRNQDDRKPAPRWLRGDARGANFRRSWELGITARTPTV